MATEKWVAGATNGWVSIFGASGANLNSMPNNSSVLDSTGDITNGAALDIYADLSVQLGSAAFASPAQVNVYIYPLNGDGSTYGDNQFPSPGTQAAKTPAPQLYVGAVVFPAATAAAYGALERIILPPGTFRFVIQAQIGTSVTLASSGNAVQYRTYNRSVA